VCQLCLDVTDEKFTYTRTLSLSSIEQQQQKNSYGRHSDRYGCYQTNHWPFASDIFGWS
jgi:hypothetical protein